MAVRYGVQRSFRPSAEEKLGEQDGDGGTSENYIKVAVRVRKPISEDYVLQGGVSATLDNAIHIGSDRESITLQKAGYDDREFFFDRVLDAQCTQEDAFDSVGKEVVEAALDGVNGTIFAYGQTGSGKTYTIFGSGRYWEHAGASTVRGSESHSVPADAGLVPRSLKMIFDYIYDTSDTTEFRVLVSFLQIYMEQVMDLLNTEKTNLAIREKPEGGVYVDGLTTVEVQSPLDVYQLVRDGARNRTTRQTLANKASSRSHAVLIFTLEQRSRMREGKSKRSLLTFVDLAGSERVSRTGLDGAGLEEAKKINKSLSALGNCISALADGKTGHVPFRDSKLTRLLSEGLSGNSRTAFVATVAPSALHYEESTSTLLFARRAMRVQTKPIVNEFDDNSPMLFLGGRGEPNDMSTAYGRESLESADQDMLKGKVAQLEEQLMRIRSLRDMPDMEASVMDFRSLPIPVPSMVYESSIVQDYVSEVCKYFVHREGDLISRYDHVIGQLELEIQKQNVLYARRKASMEADSVFESFLSTLLENRHVRKRIIERLGRPADEIAD
uniref:Kinesin motor domain-containing protein n=1 Tax=Palpitomonas bilix TaxID=652834 RepID=A0A7S3GHZ0_9EUKA|mmetsp:Transcript_50294/g.129525  ORF Transcript_50294/g.129525 Transcript_50294/m.129525 type:complete len:555 (+) Transcript_50294:72-1736(+)